MSKTVQIFGKKTQVKHLLAIAGGLFLLPLFFIVPILLIGSIFSDTPSESGLEASRVLPKEVETTSSTPSIALAYKCPELDTVELNDEKLSSEDINSLCNKQFVYDLVDGENDFRITFINGEDTYRERLTVSFNQEGYAQSIKDAEEKAQTEKDAKLAQEQKDAEEARINEEQESKERNDAFVEYANNVIDKTNTISEQMDSFSNSSSEYNMYQYAKNIKSLASPCSFSSYSPSTDNYPSDIEDSIFETTSSVSDYCLNVYGWSYRVMDYLDGKSTSYDDLDMISYYTNLIGESSVNMSVNIVVTADLMGIDLDRIK